MHRVWLAILAICLAACARDRAARRPIEIIVATDPETLDPRYATDAVSLRTTRLVHAGLVRCDPDTLAPRPYAAKGWTWTSPTSLRVELREDVRFHSGAPLRPADVVATLRAIASPAVGSRHAHVVDTIAEAREDGPHAVAILLERPHATLLTDLEVPILREDEAFAPPRPDGRLDGLGPYRVTSFAPGEVDLAPAEASAAPPAHAAVRVRAVHDENARALRLHAGRADVAVNVLSPTLLPAIEKTAGLAAASRPGANLTYLSLRVDRGPLDDPRLRRAVSLAIDRALLARTLLAGHAHPASTLVPPVHWAHTDAPALPFDPDEARRLVREAGRVGLRLSLVTSTDRLRGTVARAIAQELADVGLDVEVTPLELGTMFARMGAGDFEMAVLQITEMTEPNVLRVFLHSASVPPGGSNRGRVRDAQVDRLLDEGDAVSEPGARRAIYAELEARVREMTFLVPLWHEDQVTVTSARARAFTPSAEGRWLGVTAVDDGGSR